MPASATSASPRPRPLWQGLRRFANITLVLAVTEFKTRYFGSVLGYLWSLMRPLMLFGVLYVVFTHIVRFGSGITHYPLKLLLAIVLWSYFAEATTQGVQSLVARGDLLRKISFSPAAIPLSVSLTSAFNLGLNLIVVLVFTLASGIEPTLRWLELIPLVAVLMALTVAVATILSVLYVRYRDMQPIWEVGVQILFWGTPIIYVISTVPENFRKLIMASPLAAIIEQARWAVVDQSGVSVAAAAGGAGRLLVPVAITCALAAASARLYRRSAATIAERL